MHRSPAADPALGRTAQGRLVTDSPAATRAVGRALGAAAGPGTVLALIGPLGAGKTQLAKGVADGLGVTSVVNSPTFILMNEHAGRLRLYHIDAYRVGEPDEAAAAGLFDERQAFGVSVIEWAERLADDLPNERLEIVIEPDAKQRDRRTLRWTATGVAHTRLADDAFAIGSRSR